MKILDGSKFVLNKKLNKPFNELTHEDKVLNHFGDFWDEKIGKEFKNNLDAEFPSDEKTREMFDDYVRNLYGAPKLK